MNKKTLAVELVKIAKELQSDSYVNIEEASRMRDALNSALDSVLAMRDGHPDAEMKRWWSAAATNLGRTIHSVEEAMSWERRLSR